MKKVLLLLLACCSFTLFGMKTIVVNGISLTYRIYEGEVTIDSCKNATGALEIPATIEGLPVTTIGYYAFYNCSGLTSVTIPEGVVTIESNAFSGCTGLSYLSIPLSATDLRAGAFKDVAPETIKAIKKPFAQGDAFLGSISTKKLKTIIIPEGATSIPDNAFSNASTVTTVKIPASVTSVGARAFTSIAPTYLEAPFIPESMTGNKVKTLVVPQGVKSLAKKAFWSCTNASSITLPPDLNWVAEDAFNNVAPETLVAPFCPSNILKTNLKTLEVPEGVTSLSSFADAPKLTSVKLPTTLTKILSGAFRNCTSLPSITIPEGVESIGSYAFSGCLSLTSVTIPSSVTEIGDDVFAECPNLPKDANGFQYESVNQRLLICAPKTLSGSITLPESVCLISNQAFSKCTGITSIKLPSELIYMGPEVFSECTNLVRVDLPTSLKKIPDGAFNNCTQLKTVTIPKGIIEIGKKAFYNCGAMESITLPSSVKWFQENAFELCNGLKAVHISDIVVWATSYFKNRSANPLVYASYLYVNGELLKHLEFSTYVRRIGAYAFAGCLSLQSVILDALLIEEYAFWGCPNLNFVQLNDATGLNTIEIGDSAFDAGGSGLVKTFVFNCNPPKANWSCFDWIGYGYALKKYGPSWGKAMSSDYKWYGLEITITDVPPSLGNKIVFDANGGSGGKIIRSLPGAKLTAPTVTRDGYTFVGWEPAVPETAPGTSTTYTAQWKANGSDGDTPSVVLYTITFNANGGTGGKTVKQAAGTPLTAPTVTRTGYTFTGWSPAVPAKTPAQNVTYTAQWKVNSSGGDTPSVVLYTITFNANGGTGGTTVKQAAGTTLTAPTVTRTGYTFAGWSPAVPAKTPAQNVTYTAQWNEVNQYTMTVNGIEWTYQVSNGKVSITDCPSSISGSITIPSSLSGYPVTSIGDVAFAYCYDLTSVTIPEGVTSIGERAFSGCSSLTSVTIPSSVTSIGDSAFYNCSRLTSVTIPSSVTSIGNSAFWNCSRLTSVMIPSSVTSIGDWAFYNCSRLTSVTFEGAPPSCGSCCFENVSATGYYPSKHAETWKKIIVDGEWNDLMMVQDGDTPSVVLYTITFNANGGTGGTTVKQAAGTTLTAPTVTRTGYTFTGWSPAVPAKTPAQNVTYTAQWKVIQYQQTFDANGGAGGTSATLDYGATLTAPTVTREGYTFAGWEPAVPATVPAMPMTYKAKWTLKQYAQTFDAAGGNGGKVVSQNYGVALTAPTVTREGYTFMGWTPAVPATTPAKDVTYTAQWKGKPYQITFDAAGGTGGGTVTLDCGAKLVAPNVTRKGYVLTGWVPALPATVPAKNSRYVAQWREATIDTSLLTYTEKKGKVTITGCREAISGILEIPKYFAGGTVVAIGKGAFKGQKLEKVILPDTITSIEKDAFKDCVTLNVSTVIMPNQPKLKVDKNAFTGCKVTAISAVPGESQTGSAAGYKVATSVSGFKLNAKSGSWTATFKKPGTYEAVLFKPGANLKVVRIQVGAFPKVTIVMEGENTGCSVKGAGDYLMGKKVTLTAKASKEKIFIGFYDAQNQLKSSAMKYTFVMGNKNITLTAKFKEEVINTGISVLQATKWQVGKSYTITLPVTAESGVKSVKAKLPSGLKVTKTKAGVWQVVGSPKKAGAYTVSLTVGTVQKKQKMESYTMNVAAETFTVNTDAITTQTINIGQDLNGFTINIVATSGVKSVKASKLPSGVKLKQVNGVWQLIGTPTKAGTYTVKLTLTTKAGSKETKALTLTVSPIPYCTLGTYEGEIERTWLLTNETEVFGFGKFTVAPSGLVTGNIIYEDGSSTSLNGIAVIDHGHDDIKGKDETWVNVPATQFAPNGKVIGKNEITLCLETYEYSWGRSCFYFDNFYYDYSNPDSYYFFGSLRQIKK